MTQYGNTLMPNVLRKIFLGYKNMIDMLYSDVIFIPERNNIVSVSWDGTIKIWRSYRKQKNEGKKKTHENSQKFETWVWEQMKVAMRKQNPFDSNEYAKELGCPAILETDEDAAAENFSKTESSIN